MIVSVALLCLASQWYFNRDAEWDRWALYFFESYGLGALLAWSLHGPDGARGARHWMLLCMLSAVIAAWAFPRPRLLISVLVCLLLWLGVWRWQPSERCSTWLQRHSELSYALFLTHFMPLVVANAVWIRWGGQSPAVGVLLLVLTWGVCVVWSAMFHRAVQIVMRAAWRPRRAASST